MRTPTSFSWLIITILALSPLIHAIPTLLTTTVTPQPASRFHETIILHTNGQEFDHFGRSIGANRQTIYVGSDRADGEGFHVNYTAWLEEEQQPDDATREQETHIPRNAAWISIVLTPTLLVVTENDTQGTAGTRVVWADLRRPSDWNELLHSNTHRYLGYSLAVDGDHAMVIGDPDFERGDTAVWVFEKLEYQWETKQLLSVGTNDMFGCSVSISVNGTYIIVGAASANVDSVVEAGAVYVFAKNGTLRYHMNQTLTAPYPSSLSNFGWSVTTYNNWIMISAPKSHTVYAFRRDSQRNMFVHWQSIVQEKGSLFGYSLSFSGVVLVVGSPHENQDSGAVHLYQQVCSEWQYTAKLVASDASPGDHFGHAVFLVGNIIAVGAPMKNRIGLEFGSAYYYLFNQTEIAVPCTYAESPSPSSIAETPTTSPITTFSVSPTAMSEGKEDNVPIGALIGGVLGGVALMVVAAVISLVIMRRRHPVPLVPSTDGDVMRADRGLALPADEMILEAATEAEVEVETETGVKTRAVKEDRANRNDNGAWEPSATDASVTRDRLPGAGGSL